jgi:hypothetical protein
MIAILTDSGVGGTFLTWTIHYLAGDSEYFSVDKNSWVTLPVDPLNGSNAHKFKPNQPTNLLEFERIFNGLKAVSNQTIYFHRFYQDTDRAIDELVPCASKTVLLALDPKDVLYQCRYQPRNSVRQSIKNPNKVIVGADAFYNEDVEVYFSESKSVFDAANLHDVWDRREFIALNFNPFSTRYISEFIDPTADFFKLDAMEMWTTLDKKILELFNFLEIELCQSRLTNWQSIYNTWKQVHVPSINFINNFETIIENILVGQQFDLEQFNLDIQQEAAIQHALMYRHNLNLKTWQLTKFTNTLQLHNLLEPCHHDLSLSRIRDSDPANP